MDAILSLFWLPPSQEMNMVLMNVVTDIFLPARVHLNVRDTTKSENDNNNDRLDPDSKYVINLK